jgi:hypothetical protein
MHGQYNDFFSATFISTAGFMNSRIFICQVDVTTGNSGFAVRH